VRKLGVPGHEEYAMGAIAGGGIRLLNAPDQGLDLTEKRMRSTVAEKQLDEREAGWTDAEAPEIYPSGVSSWKRCGPTSARRSVLPLRDAIDFYIVTDVALTPTSRRSP
jgi:hypothetical protein